MSRFIDPVDRLYSFPHILEKIFLFLSWRELDRCQLVCKDWKNFLGHSVLARPSVRKILESRDYGDMWTTDPGCKVNIVPCFVERERIGENIRFMDGSRVHMPLIIDSKHLSSRRDDNMQGGYVQTINVLKKNKLQAQVVFPKSKILRTMVVLRDLYVTMEENGQVVSWNKETLARGDSILDPLCCTSSLPSSDYHTIQTPQNGRSRTNALFAFNLCNEKEFAGFKFPDLFSNPKECIQFQQTFNGCFPDSFRADLQSRNSIVIKYWEHDRNVVIHVLTQDTLTPAWKAVKIPSVRPYNPTSQTVIRDRFLFSVEYNDITFFDRGVYKPYCHKDSKDREVIAVEGYLVFCATDYFSRTLFTFDPEVELYLKRLRFSACLLSRVH